ncbi:MAG: OmpA family protein [Pseudomonadota bacterium]
MMSTRTHFAGFVVALTLVLTGAPVKAQKRNGGPIDLQLFRPAMDSKGFITLNASQILGHLDLSFGLAINFSRRPLNLSGNPAGGTWCQNGGATCLSGDANYIFSRYLIDNMMSGNLQAALGLFRHFEIGVGLPFSFWQGDTAPNPEDVATGTKKSGIDAQGIGDLGIHFKGRILNTSKHPVGLAVVTSLYVPTGDKEAFLGSGRFQIAPSVVVDKEFFQGQLRLAANIGARLRFGSATPWTDTRNCEKSDGSGTTAQCGITNMSLEETHHLTYGVGASYAVVPQRFDVVAELIGQTGFDGFYDFGKMNSAHEILAAVKLYLARNSYFTIGLGRGLRGQTENYQYGSPDIRAFVNFVFEPSIGDRDRDGIKDDVDKCPDDPEDFDDFEDEDGCPDPDNDRDGILDVDDRCPNEPEDKDGFEDEDGCPEANILDRDGDGIPDHKDRCPDDPEDKDGFEDEDGCPDPDNDKDKILDVDDVCPNDPEDIDGFEDEDGCPDPDNDKDRILDVDDSCPNEPETYNGYKDEDGCPDKGRVVVHKGRIEILDKIYFETDKAIIRSISYPILNAIAATLKGNPQILKVEIQGHADERGSDDYNLRLTDDRANAVRIYLIDNGVEAERLSAKGYGETRPVDKSHNEAAWSKNRRSEFVILKRSQ